MDQGHVWSMQRSILWWVFAAAALELGACSDANDGGGSTASRSAVGVNYGTLADDLPPPDAVAALLKSSTAITRVKLFNADPTILTALANTGIDVVVGISNADVADLGGRPGRAASYEAAVAWVASNVAPYLPATRIVAIAVGNEALLTRDRELLTRLLPAMQNLHEALASLNLDSAVKISSPQTLSLLRVSLPPSAGAFRAGLVKPFIGPILSFLSNTSSPFMANVYPFFAYQGDPTPDMLSYALFTSTAGYTDPLTQLHYTNMFDAQLDALFSAMSGIGFPNISLLVSETGWPSLGDPDQPGVNILNAQTYTNNLVKHLSSNQGTPLRPRMSIDTYIFALFNENLKPGPTTERNYGLFKPDMSPVYSAPSIITNTGHQVSLHSSPMSTSTNASGTPPSPSPPPPSSLAPPLIPSQTLCILLFSTFHALFLFYAHR